MKYYIGVDGGGTKTQYAMFDENKNMIATVKGPGSNHENMEGGIPEAANLIFDGLNAVAKEAGIALSDVSFTLMGLAGIDHQYQHDDMCAELKAKGFENFEIFNDGFIVVKAGATGEAAIGYNLGTGTCCNAIDSDGKMLQLAGLDVFSGDKGNGHWIAAQTFRIIYDDIYLGKRKSAVTKMYMDEYGLKDKEEFLASVSVFETEDANNRIMRLIDFFFDASKLGDEAVMEVIEEIAQRGADFITSHLRQLNFREDEVEVVLSGSVHTKLPNEVYLEALEKKVAAATDKKVKYIKLTQLPVVGCVNWIFQKFI